MSSNPFYGIDGNRPIDDAAQRFPADLFPHLEMQMRPRTLRITGVANAGDLLPAKDALTNLQRFDGADMRVNADAAIIMAYRDIISPALRRT
jgi:hypothetical protein